MRGYKRGGRGEGGLARGRLSCNCNSSCARNKEALVIDKVAAVYRRSIQTDSGGAGNEQGGRVWRPSMAPGNSLNCLAEPHANANITIIIAHGPQTMTKAIARPVASKLPPPAVAVNPKPDSRLCAAVACRRPVQFRETPSCPRSPHPLLG